MQNKSNEEENLNHPSTGDLATSLPEKVPAREAAAASVRQSNQLPSEKPAPPAPQELVATNLPEGLTAKAAARAASVTDPPIAAPPERG